MSETHLGHDGKIYATARCKECGTECHAMSGEYRFYKLCPACLRAKTERGEEPKEDE